ncbi:MAG TPA: SDR family NAD(P)-dependent oxidoreductase [Bacteroidales bacterium]|nr:SDR family NAD(P)-dependent oxidoreductase [Bacteroidales bacterium]
MENEYYTLITGASRGIGRAIAFEMALRKHNLILHSLPGEDLNTICKTLVSEYGIIVRSFEIDLTETDGPMKLFREIESNELHVNILINNAGIGIEGPLESYSKSDIDNIIFLNIRALTLLTTLFIPSLKKTDSYILNISSLGSYIAAPYKSVYLASKSYIFYFTRALEAELKGTSVKTCIFAPGAVRTNRNVLERIRKAGWMSERSSISAEEVARKGIRAMFRGKRVVVPGIISRFIFTISFIIPEGIILAITRNIFRREFPV